MERLAKGLILLQVAVLLVFGTAYLHLTWEREPTGPAATVARYCDRMSAPTSEKALRAALPTFTAGAREAWTELLDRPTTRRILARKPLPTILSHRILGSEVLTASATVRTRLAVQKRSGSVEMEEVVFHLQKEEGSWRIRAFGDGEKKTDLLLIAQLMNLADEFRAEIELAGSR